MNNQLFPFERNRYYTGKMLTSADFMAEQTYINNKRRFINSQLFGAGIVCGCSVYSLDDLSIFVESGFAIDSLGHEIVIDNSVVRKLSAVKGFDRIESDRLTLCVKYTEEHVHPVYSIKKQGSGQEYEYNHIKEGYELFLMDSARVSGKNKTNDEFLISEKLLKNEDYEITFQMPASVCKGKYICLKVTAQKLSQNGEPLNYAAVLKMPSFTTSEDSHELELRIDGAVLEKGESLVKKYWVYVQDVPCGESVLNLCSDSSAQEASLSFKTFITDLEPDTLVDREIARPSLEVRDNSSPADYICLADIELVRNGSAYIIEKIIEYKARKYIEAPSTERLRREYLGYFGNPDLQTKKVQQEVRNENEGTVSKEKKEDVQITTGTLEIPVGKRVKAGAVYYSGEIMHGLGAGTVYVELGSEFVEDTPTPGANVKSTVFGEASLFEELEGKTDDVQTAVKVLNDKGSFVVAARFLHDTDCTVLSFRWVAIKFAGIGAGEAHAAEAGQWIEAETPTAVIGTKETFYFGVKFHNMDRCSVCYEVTEEGGGSIMSDGVYTAPSKEGVYEIRIYCMDRPFISTYAYAVVKKK